MTQLPLGLKVSAAISVLTTLILFGIALFRPHGQAVGIIAGNFGNVISAFAGICTGLGALLAAGLLYFLKPGPMIHAVAHILFLGPPLAVLYGVLRIYR
jgi:hypothetical protein